MSPASSRPERHTPPSTPARISSSVTIPHVLQGFEWYKGRLIAYSLGNFVFDQDFLSTFPSVILRTIFEGDRMIDARDHSVDDRPLRTSSCRRCRRGSASFEW